MINKKNKVFAKFFCCLIIFIFLLSGCPTDIPGGNTEEIICNNLETWECKTTIILNEGVLNPNYVMNAELIITYKFDINTCPDNANENGVIIIETEGNVVQTYRVFSTPTFICDIEYNSPIKCEVYGVYNYKTDEILFTFFGPNSGFCTAHYDIYDDEGELVKEVSHSMYWTALEFDPAEGPTLLEGSSYVGKVYTDNFWEGNYMTEFKKIK